MLMMLNLLLTVIFLFLNHPLTMGLILLMQTMLIALITGLLNINFWFSYILFLIMVGGMLVLFIYMTSIASNEMFNYSNKIMLTMLMMILMIMLFTFLTDNFLFSLNMNFMENNFIFNSNIMLIKFFNYPSMFMIFFMIIYLFITLVAVVKITKIEYGPLRQKF
uniref:NADH-ubiquinone oxidoreductase chain 6 n=1 Tax=Staphylinidae sp. BMNH 1274251 TaxID=1796572 RepID=A0A126TEY5_9COLE|nr:NADH dehydrogenase subunit 6 [Staphylinidae sp. BMNH 1274251]